MDEAKFAWEINASLSEKNDVQNNVRRRGFDDWNEKGSGTITDGIRKRQDEELENSRTNPSEKHIGNYIWGKKPHWNRIWRK